MINNNYDWNAVDFFKRLSTKNKLSCSKDFKFKTVSGLDGFYDSLSGQNSPNTICVSDVSSGYTSLENTPSTRRVKTVFMSMRHAAENTAARDICLTTMREIFRQFMTVLLQESVQIAENHVRIDTRIKFNEIDKYFFQGVACAYFQIAVDTPTNLMYDGNDWE